jgi:hypothetical protein
MLFSRENVSFFMICYFLVLLPHKTSIIYYFSLNWSGRAAIILMLGQHRIYSTSAICEKFCGRKRRKNVGMLCGLQACIKFWSAHFYQYKAKLLQNRRFWRSFVVKRSFSIL